MAALVALSLLASQAAAALQPPAQSTHTRVAVSASARASVVILSGAKVSLSGAAEAQGYKLNAATITLEDGSRRPAKLVEFQ